MAPDVTSVALITDTAPVPGAVPALEPLLNDDDNEVRQEAAKALKKLKASS